jgi:uncharacterized protein YabN with tetrapyrrole methylase and pyrophosphatase domain
MIDSFKHLIDLCRKSLRLDPWVKERGLAGYCEEIASESQEAIEAVKKTDYENLKEELGDILLDWCHACLLAEEEGLFTTKEVIEGLQMKISRRKPYLSQGRVPSKEEASQIWKMVKQQEKDEKAKKSIGPR